MRNIEKLWIALFCVFVLIPFTPALADTTGMILGEYDEIMDVDEIQWLDIKLESDGIEDEITVSSDAPNVLTVDEQEPEKLTAISPGNARITIQSGNITEEIDITVLTPYVPVRGISLNSYSALMNVGDTQYISAFAVPDNATYGSISYSSSDEGVLTVNSDGLVTAIAAGTADIYMYAEDIYTSVTIVAQTSAVIEVTDIDIDYQSTMTVGTSQLIVATVIPLTTNDQMITFSSSDPSILTVNAIGRVYAQTAGTAQITLTAGDIMRTISITAKTDELDTRDTVLEKVWPSSIDVADFTGKLAVNDITTIHATVYPTNATEQQLTYSSSNTNVATVSTGGRVTGVSKGMCTITVMSGGISKSLSLTVYVKTTSFNINKSYVMLQPGKTFQLEVSALPEDADQDFLYTSTDESILTVDKNGLITAVSTGYASVIVKNYDSEAVVTIVVNNKTEPESGQDSKSDVSVARTVDYNNVQQVVSMIQSVDAGETIKINGDGLEMITSDILAALYANKSKLQVLFSDYDLLIDGAVLKNPNNELNPIIAIAQNGDNAEFILNELNNLPGIVTIRLSVNQNEFKYLYLFNESTKHYEKLKSFDGITMHLDTPGHYVLTSAIYRELKINWTTIILTTSLCIIGIVAFVVIKKRYWFW